MLIARPSGLDIAKEGGNDALLFSLPAFALIALFVALTGKNYKILGQLAGIVPFAILAYGLNQFGKDLFQGLQIGAWLCLVFGLALVVAARK